MTNYTLQERVNNKFKKLMVPIMAGHNRKKLNNTDFTIISNNCWGGVCYEYFNLQKNSPTIGSYFFADDYIKMIQNLKHYLETEIEIINARDSNHYEILKEINQLEIPVGKLDDVEIVFRHYPNPMEAKEKWKRRVDRINWNNIIIKFSYMSQCTDEHIAEFQRVKGIKKFCFVPREFDSMEDLFIYPSCINSMTDLGDDVFYWNKYVDVVDLINRPVTGIDKLTIG